MRKGTWIVAVALLVGACGGVDGDELAYDGSEVAEATDALKIDFKYKCTRLEDSADGDRGDVVYLHLLAQRGLYGDSADVNAERSDVWTFDKSWRSNHAVPYVRYLAPKHAGNTVTLEVQKPMRSNGGATMNNGSKGGYAILHTTGPRVNRSDRLLCFRSVPERASGGRAFIDYALQFVGTYRGTGHVKSLAIARDGTYSAKIDSATETGTVSAPDTLSQTVVFTLHPRTGSTWTATVEGYDSKLHVVHGRAREELTATTAVGPNEGVCDDSDGQWLDDDAGANGLYCVCYRGRVYIPSAGGCVY